MSRSFVVCVAAFAVAALAHTAVAAPASDTIVVLAAAPISDGYITKQMTVHYDDLNISEQQGAAALYDRINKAALRTCGAKKDFTIRRTMADRVEKCRAEAVKNAIAKVTSPALRQVATAAKK